MLTTLLDDNLETNNSSGTNILVVDDELNNGNDTLGLEDDIDQEFTNSTTDSDPIDYKFIVGYGVPQPEITSTDTLIIIFMISLWAYSIILTYRAWYKILHSDQGQFTCRFNLCRKISYAVRRKTTSTREAAKGILTNKGRENTRKQALIRSQLANVEESSYQLPHSGVPHPSLQSLQPSTNHPSLEPSPRHPSLQPSPHHSSLRPSPHNHTGKQYGGAATPQPTRTCDNCLAAPNHVSNSIADNQSDQFSSLSRGSLKGKKLPGRCYSSLNSIGREYTLSVEDIQELRYYRESACSTPDIERGPESTPRTCRRFNHSNHLQNTGNTSSACRHSKPDLEVVQVHQVDHNHDNHHHYHHPHHHNCLGLSTGHVDRTACKPSSFGSLRTFVLQDDLVKSTQ